MDFFPFHCVLLLHSVAGCVAECVAGCVTVYGAFLFHSNLFVRLEELAML